jgi:hypothetical protein
VPTPSAEGDFDELPLLSGQGVGLIHNIAPISEVVNEIVIDAAQILARSYS